MEGRRATRALIHIRNLQHNFLCIKKTIPDDTMICASVKANAYGHGMDIAARVLRDCGVEFLGIATPWEGYQLRQGAAADEGRIILYGPASIEEIPVIAAAAIEPMVTSREYISSLVGEMDSRDRMLKVHLKVDTGMGRVGCRPDETLELARMIDRSSILNLAGLATHYPVADSADEGDMEFTRGQSAMLKELAEGLRDDGIDPGIIHAANSGAIALHRDLGEAKTMVRPGIALYGYGPDLPGEDPQRPVMELSTRITELKKVPAGTSISYGRTWKAPEDTWIATLPLGYADGYPRVVSNKAEVLIDGRRHPVVGTICMDQCMVNLGPESSAEIGDRVTIFGPDPAGPDAEEIAGLAGTISYEITCGISARVPRHYLD